MGSIGQSGNLMINGVNVNAQHLIKLDKGVNQTQAMDAARDNGLDEIMVVDQEAGEAYMAYGQGLNFSGFDGYQEGQQVLATLDGKRVAVVPFVAEINGQIVAPTFDDEINSAGDGASEALGVAKNVGLKVLGMAKDNAIEIVGAGMTLGAMARMGGAKVATTAGQGIMSKAGTWAFGPAKELTGQAMKGFGKVAKWGGIIAGTAAVVGVGGTAIYGATRSGNAAAIEQLGTKLK